MGEKVEDSEDNEGAKIATKDTKNKQPEKGKVKGSVTLSKDAKDTETQKEKTKVRKVPEKKISKKGTPSDTKDDSSPTPEKRKDDTKKKNNKDAKPKTVSEQAA